MRNRIKAVLATMGVVILCCTQSGCGLYCGFIVALDMAFYGADPDNLPLAACGTHFTYATVTSAPSGDGMESNNNDTFEPMSLPMAPNPNSNSYAPPPPLVIAGPAAAQPNGAAGTLPPNLPPALSAIPASNRQASIKFGNLGGPR